MYTLPREMYFVVGPLLVAIGILNCFFGYRLFKFVLGICGSLLGSMIVGSAVFSASGANQIAGIIGAVVGAFVGGWAMSYLYFLGIFAIGAILGIAVGAALTFGFQSELAVSVASAILGLGFGILALFLQKTVIIWSTAFSGALYAVAGGSLMLSQKEELVPPGQLPEMSAAAGLALVVWICVGILGLIFQQRTTRRLPARYHRRQKRVPDQNRETQQAST